jgi:hypothetical protein
MALTDDELLAFDRGRHANWDEQDEERAQRLLVEQPELFRNHLTIAKWIDRWVEHLQEGGDLRPDYEYSKGVIKGLRGIAAYLRQGDLVPGGDILRDNFGD